MKHFLSTIWGKTSTALALVLVLVLIVQVPAVHALIGREIGPGTSYSGQNITQPLANSNGLVAWYPLDGDVKDYGPNGYNGTQNNFNGNTDGYIAGKFGKGLEFNATNSDYVSTTAQTPYNFSNTTFSVAFWVNTTYSGSTTEALVAADGATGGWSLGIKSGEMNVTLENGSGSPVINTNEGPSLADGYWHFVVWEITTSTSTPASNTAILYVDGTVSQGTLTGATNTYAVPTVALSLGEQNLGGGSNLNFTGTLDDVRIYNRGITTTEISQLDKGTIAPPCDQSCVAWWKLDDGMSNSTTTTAVDSTGNGHTGTLNGSYTFNGTTNGWVSGVFGGGLWDNNALGSFITVPYSAAYDFSGSSTFTLSMWVMDDGSNGSGLRGLLGDGSFQTSGYTIGYNNTAFTIEVEYASNSCNAVTAAGAFKTNQWVLMTYVNTPAVMKLYVNGVLSQTKAQCPWLATGSTGLDVGRTTQGGWSTFQGRLDDVRIYNRLLTSDEIAAMYNAGRSS